MKLCNKENWLMKNITEFIILIFFGFVFYLNLSGFLNEENSLKNTKVEFKKLTFNGQTSSNADITIALDIENKMNNSIVIDKILLNLLSKDKFITKFNNDTLKITISSNSHKSVHIPFKLNESEDILKVKTIIDQNKTRFVASGMITVSSPETNELIDISYYSDLPVNREAIVQVVEMDRN